MRKSLYLLWGIIIIGIVFIFFHVIAPPSGEYIPPETPDEEPEEVLIIEDVPIDFDEEEKGYAQLIEEGDFNMENDNPEDAIKNYQAAHNIRPDSTEPLKKLGHAYLKNNQAPQAKLTFEKALQIEPDSVELNLSLAQANLGVRDAETAKDIIWSLDKENPKVKYYRGIIYILAEEFDRAEQTFKEVDDEKSQIFLNKFAKFSHFTEADPLFLKMLLAKALTEVEQFEAAIPFLFNILNQKNNYRDAWIVLGYAYLNVGKSAEAIDALNQARVFSPHSPQTLFYLGLAHSAEENTSKAIDYLEAADLAGYRPKENIKIHLGDLYLTKERYAQAASNYRTILDINQENLEVFVRAIWINIDKLNNSDEALRLAKKAFEHHPEEAMSHNLLGWAYTATGDFTQAEKHLKIALEMQEDFDAAQLNMGWLKEKQGLYEEAKEYYKEAYKLGQGNSIGNRAAIRFNELTKKLISS